MLVNAGLYLRLVAKQRDSFAACKLGMCRGTTLFLKGLTTRFHNREVVVRPMVIMWSKIRLKTSGREEMFPKTHEIRGLKRLHVVLIHSLPLE